jgi:hypothetical protein
MGGAWNGGRQRGGHNWPLAYIPREVRVLRPFLLLLWCSAAWAGGGPAIDAYDDIGDRALDAHVLVDLYLQHDFAEPPSGRVQLRSFDFTDGPAIGFLRLTLAHKPKRVGFRIDFGVGDLADGLYNDDPLATTDPEAARWLSRVEQAFLTVIVPVGSGLQIDAGKFNTPIGWEDNESLTNWNYSRSLLFTWAEPSVQSGVRVSYDFGDWATSLFWLNGWNANFAGGNDLRSGALAVRWKKGEKLEISLVWAAGLERAPTHLADPTLTFRSLIDVSLRYNPVRRLTLVATADWGNDRAQGGIDFGGAAVYASVEATDWLRATVRAELLADPEGYATGHTQYVGEVTETVELRGKIAGAGLALRLEARQDQSSAPVFDGAGGPRTSQDTVTAALLAWY